MNLYTGKRACSDWKKWGRKDDSLMEGPIHASRSPEGNVSICGIPVEDAREIRRIVGICPREFLHVSEYDGMDGRWIIWACFPAWIKKQKTEDSKNFLYKVKSTGRPEEKVKSIIRGMKRWLGINPGHPA